MNRKAGISLLLTLLTAAAAAAQNSPQAHRASNPRPLRQPGIQLVQSDELPGLPPPEIQALPELPGELPMRGLDDYDRLAPIPLDANRSTSSRARQPLTMGHIFDDDERGDEQCEWQFCEHVWQCAGGRSQSWWSRWRRDFGRSSSLFCQGAFGAEGCRLLGGCGLGCGLGGGCGMGCGRGACTGPGMGGYDGTYGTPSYGGPSYGGPSLGQPMPAGPMPTGIRSVARDPYVSALEARNPNVEVVGPVQILEDRVIR